MLIGISKPGPLKFNFSFQGFGWFVRILFCFRNKIFIIEYFKHAFTGNDPHLQYIELISEDTKRTEQQIQEKYKSQHRSLLTLVQVQRLLRGAPNYKSDSKCQYNFNDREKHR